MVPSHEESPPRNFWASSVGTFLTTLGSSRDASTTLTTSGASRQDEVSLSAWSESSGSHLMPGDRGTPQLPGNPGNGENQEKNVFYVDRRDKLCCD